MQFEWDEAKRQQNIQKHGFDFRDAWQIFNSPMLIALDERYDYGEDRWIGLGTIQTQVVIVVYTELNENVIRIISIRKAMTHERNRYEQLLRDELGND